MGERGFVWLNIYFFMILTFKDCVVLFCLVNIIGRYLRKVKIKVDFLA